MNDVTLFHTHATDMPEEHKNEHPSYEYYRRNLLPRGLSKESAVSLYELPLGKSAFPYHYHLKNEESYYILKGTGKIKTPQGELIVTEGDFIFFPANANGAHKMTNTSDTESLIYLDFDTIHDVEVAVYPDTNKIGIFTDTIRQLHKRDESVPYYEGEEVSQ